MPCTETSSEAGNCQSEDPASCSVHDLVSTVCTLLNFQSKGHGQHGIVGELAQGLAIQTPGLV